MFVKVKKNNGGFSLVELIVVIAISVVLIGAATISIRSVMGVEVKQCARNIESIINKTRVTSMGKDSAVLKIYKASDGAYYYKMTINGTESDPSKIGKSRIEVIFASIKRTSKKQFLCYNPFVYSSLLVQKCTTTEQS